MSQINTLALNVNFPLSGIVLPLSVLPDPVFASGIIGEGVAIDPTGNKISSPLNATIKHIHAAKHAITLLHDNGLELLIHLGIDTVRLKGEGIVIKVSEGDRVETGQILSVFDPDYIATHAKSLMTPIIITSQHQFEIVSNKGFLNDTGDVLFVIKNNLSSKNTTQEVLEEGGSKALGEVKIRNKHGIHARPAAQIVNQAKQYEGKIYLVNSKEERAFAASVTDILKLNLQCGDKIKIEIYGKLADVELEKVIQQFESGLGETLVSAFNHPIETVKETPLLHSLPIKDNVEYGACAVPGLAIGRAKIIRKKHNQLIAESVLSVDAEKTIFERALKDARAQLETEINQLSNEKFAIKSIFKAHVQILSDPSLIDKTMIFIESTKTAAWSWQQVVDSETDLLLKQGGYLAERAADIRDVGDRVLSIITGKELTFGKLEKPSIVICDTITPKDIVGLDKAFLQGIVCIHDGVNSHAAIIARSFKLPYLVGVSENVLTLQEDRQLILDATQGELIIEPSDEVITAQKKQIKDNQLLFETAKKSCKALAVSADGIHVEVAANIGNAESAKESTLFGADSVGLLRTEFMYLEAQEEPSFDEQVKLYKTLFSFYRKDQMIIVRTLDVGGDKSIPFINLAKEENPFLGVRGIRVGINKPSLLKNQINALIAAAEGRESLHILIPMIASIEELRAVKLLIKDCQGSNPLKIIIGVMIEVPSAAIMADILAKEADFFSIGTNDLTQYTLAMDRGNPNIAHWSDGLHPAVLRLIRQTITAAHKEKKWVGVCGNVGSDPTAVPILLGLGVDEISVSVKDIPLVKHQIRQLKITQCNTLANQVLKLENADAVRQYVNHWMHKTR